MIFGFRWLIRVILILMVALFERAIGLPIIMIFLTALYTNRLEKSWRWTLLLVVSFFMATLFMTSLLVSWLVVSISYLWTNYDNKIIPSRLLRLVISSSIGSMVLVYFGLGLITWVQTLYGLVALSFCIMWLKRYRFYLQ